MIHLVCGKLGSGKGLVSVQILMDEITKGTRDIVTNLPLRFGPWVDGSGQPQIGLVGYLQRTYKGETFDVERRVKVIEDIKLGGDLWLWRRHPERGWFKVTANVDEKGQPISFDAEQMRDCAPCLVITDEAWQFYPARSYQSIPRVLEFYGRQQRKLRDEWYIVTQHHKDVDVMLHRICQDFTICRNHGMERLGVFRQPSIFRTQTYNQPPDKTARVFHERMFKLDVKGLAQCYDTSAGVGIAGGFAADRNTKRKGLHIGWLGVAILLLVVGLFSVPMGMGKLSSAWIASTVGGKGLRPNVKTNSVPRVAATVTASGVTSPPAVASGPVVVTPASVTTNVCMTGVVQVGGRTTVLLSDGRIVSSDNSALQLVTREWCLVDGVRYNMRN